MYKALFVLFGLIALTFCRAQENDPLAVAAALQDAAQGPTLVMVTGAVTDELALTVSGKIIFAEMQPGKAPIILVIDSYGGSLDSAVTVIGAITLCKNHPVYTMDIGQADSAAAFIFSYGQKRVMWPGASLMYHNGYFEVKGKAKDIIASLTHDLKRAETIERHIAGLTNGKVSYANFRLHLDSEAWWLTAEEANALGFSTAIGTLLFN